MRDDEMMAAMHWRPITDLEATPSTLELPELRSLDALWSEQRDELEQLDGMQLFRERLARSWAIETGVIERVYDLDRGTTELLIERGIDASLIDRSSTDKDPNLVARIIGDQREAIEGLFAFIRRDRALSTSYVKELHAVLTRSQQYVDALDQFGNEVQVPLVHGEWKRQPNNPRRPDGAIHEYCPPEHVDAEMDRLIAMHLQHEGDGVAPEVEAAWLHHRFTQIHPFQDGNGRVARALATLVFLRTGWFPLTVHRDHKGRYIDALEAADRGELQPLSRMFGTLQRDELIRALGIADQTARERQGVEQLIHAARDNLLHQSRSGVAPEQLDRVRSTASALQVRAKERLMEVKRSIDREISEYRPEFSAFVDHVAPGDDRATWYRPPVIRGAKAHHYFANPRAYQSWLRLRITDREAHTWDDLIVSFHAIGREFRGLIAVSAFYEQHELDVDGEQGARRLVDSANITDELFQINYLDSREQALDRFGHWLEGVIAIGLGRWQAGLGSGSGT